MELASGTPLAICGDALQVTMPALPSEVTKRRRHRKRHFRTDHFFSTQVSTQNSNREAGAFT